jgi:hypothetical protein
MNAQAIISIPSKEDRKQKSKRKEKNTKTGAQAINASIYWEYNPNFWRGAFLFCAVFPHRFSYSGRSDKGARFNAY